MRPIKLIPHTGCTKCRGSTAQSIQSIPAHSPTRYLHPVIATDAVFECAKTCIGENDRMQFVRVNQRLTTTPLCEIIHGISLVTRTEHGFDSTDIYGGCCVSAGVENLRFLLGSPGNPPPTFLRKGKPKSRGHEDAHAQAVSESRRRGDARSLFGRRHGKSGFFPQSSRKVTARFASNRKA